MLKHAKTCDVVDDADPSTVSPSDWNADHVIDEAGISFTSATVDPPTPAPGKLTLYAREMAGRGMLRVKAPTGVDIVLQPSLLENSIWLVTPNVTTGVSTLGGGANLRGTVSTPQPTAITFGHITNFATTASSNTVAAVEHVNYPFSRHSGVAYAGGFTCVMRLAFPDASYGAGSTGCRFFAGFDNAPQETGSTESDDPATRRIGFSYSTTKGDSYFMITAKDGTTENRFSSGMLFESSKLYDFYIFAKAGGDTIGYRIDNLSDGTSVSGQVSENLPLLTHFMKCGVSLRTLSAVARSFRMKKIYVESDI